jgi:hypothetical protein
MIPLGQYFMDRDNSAHWYLVDSRMRAEWDAWLELDESDERSWQTPPFARRLNQHPSGVEFFLACEPNFC